MSELVGDLLFDGPTDGPTLVLAHGAGGAMDSEFMQKFATELGAAGVRVVRFEFAYMARRRTSDRRPPPDREAVLLARWRAVVAQLGGGGGLVIGGKSMGGRMASMVADELGVRGLVCLGYPFHPPGAPEKTRTAHLAELRTPTLIVQGERDPFGRRDDIAGYTLSQAIEVHWMEDGNHDLAPPAASGRTKRQNWDEAITTVAEFVLAR